MDLGSLCTRQPDCHRCPGNPIALAAAGDPAAGRDRSPKPLPFQVIGEEARRRGGKRYRPAPEEGLLGMWEFPWQTDRRNDRTCIARELNEELIAVTVERN